jgi:long-chain acyl-CoA synthetase
MEPFQIVRMGESNSSRQQQFLSARGCEYDWQTVVTAAPALGAQTIPSLWQYVLDKGLTTPAYLEEQTDGWRAVAWAEAAERVEALGKALLARGVGKGDAVAVLARTRLEWLLLDWAIMSIGAVVVGLYPTNTAAECAYILEHAEACLAFAENEEQYEKLASVYRGPIVRFEDIAALEAEGRAYDGPPPEPIGEDDVATLIYTSGTTGPPKGVILTHRNLVTAASRATSSTSEDDIVLLFLPMAHSFARIAHQGSAYNAATVALVADVTRVPEALQRTRPTFLPAVPRVFEKIHANTLGEIERAGGVRTTLGRWALRVGARVSARRRAGEPISPFDALQERLADTLVFAKVKQRLGGRLRMAVSGAAPLSLEVLEFFNALGIVVVEGYGLTETSSSLSVNQEDHYKLGTVGPPVEGCEVKLDEDGEILVKSASVFAGYFKDPVATAAAFTEDGWFRTGDVGEIDADGFIKITDRKKDLIITAGGKNIAPQNIENALKASRFISQAVAIGDRRPYVTALITLDWDEVRASGRDENELVQGIVDEVNRDRVRVEQVKRFKILPRDFSLEEGELTPTLKLRRRVVQEHFADEIEQLYA